VFEVPNFDVLICHPIEKLLTNAPNSGSLSIRLGKETITVPIIRTQNSVAEISPIIEPMEEVLEVNLIESSESTLEEEAEEFIKEEADFDEILELPKFKKPTRPPIELKPLPSGLRYAFLNNDVESPVIISDKLSEEETSKLIAVLEKHRAVLGYTLQDLKGISPTLCTHRIPIDPTMLPSKEPQRRLNNEMREVVMKELLKLLHSGIIYPIPYSEWVSLVQIVPKKGDMTVVENSKNKLIPQRTVTGWRMCIDYCQTRGYRIVYVAQICTGYGIGHVLYYDDM
jgi:hypothetical protein